MVLSIATLPCRKVQSRCSWEPSPAFLPNQSPGHIRTRALASSIPPSAIRTTSRNVPSRISCATQYSGLSTNPSRRKKKNEKFQRRKPPLPRSLPEPHYFVWIKRLRTDQRKFWLRPPLHAVAHRC